MNNTISVVIVTYKRPDDLKNCLQTVLKQTLLPQEVFVIDNAKDSATKNLVEGKSNDFKKKGVALNYIPNTREDSLMTARNLGAELSSGSFVSMVDDDLLLDRDYHKEIMRVFNTYPKALGVQGYCQTTKEAHPTTKKRGIKERVLDLYGRVFQASVLLEKNSCKVLPSLAVTYPYPSIKKVINCQWLAGGAAVYKREALQEFPFDENLKRFAWGFDQEHPYLIFKKYPESLFLTPFAKWWDNASPKGRLMPKELFYMMEVYELYVFYKIIDQTLGNKLRYLWRRGGQLFFRRVLFNLITLGRGNPRIGFLKMRYALGAAWYAFINRKKIKKGDLTFFNKNLTS